MDKFGRDHGDDEYSVTGDKQEFSFIDFEYDESVCNYQSNEDEPVVISNPFPFVRGKPQSVFVGETFSYPITLENTTRESVPLWGVKIFCSNPADSFTLSLLKPPSVDSDANYIQRFLEGFSLDDRTLQPQRPLTIWLTCKPKEIGLHTSIVELDVGDDRIERVVFLLAEDKVSQSLSTRKPYSRIPRRGQAAHEFSVAAAHNVKAVSKGFNFMLPQFEIPEEVRNLLTNKKIPEIVREGLKREKYADYFSTLLIMEELHLEKEMRNYDTLNAKIKTRRNRLLALELPGLAERRPSLVHGDIVFARLTFEDPNHSTPTHQGYIYRIEADEVLLKFREDFHMQHHPRNLYDIQFSCNRVNMRRLYQAVQAAESLDLNLLFPSEVIEWSNKGTPVVPFASLNQKQLLSVEMILGCKGAPPYVIHGPPGTGKTMTVVEAILQLYTKRKNARILVCAASNSAADHILKKIVSDKTAEMKDNEVFRLNASSRQYEDVKHDFLRFCYFENSIFRCPPLNALLCYRVVISTYMSSSLLLAEGIKPGHFSHIFLDEAGQASEPETMVPMANLCRQDTVVVLAGDPKQLGPVVYSDDAMKFGLGVSYLERLMTCEHYSNGDKNFMTKLVNNYRCHPTILHLPSRLFYSGELIASKEDTSSQKSLLQLLPCKDFRILFVGIQGCDEREGNNPSWFNRIEVSKVVDLIKKLTASADVKETDIGIIAPYRQQVLKISKVLETLEIFDVKVGSVEQFQGQERDVIIVSTVRSTVKHNEFDRTYSIGFLSNPRRFNVAITRAKSLLVIVGNPHIICKDIYWQKLLWYCVDNNSYQGCPLPRRLSEDVEEPTSKGQS